MRSVKIFFEFDGRPNSKPTSEFPFMPGRVLLQDFTGVPVVVDIAAMRDAVKEIESLYPYKIKRINFDKSRGYAIAQHI